MKEKYCMIEKYRVFYIGILLFFLSIMYRNFVYKLKLKIYKCFFDVWIDFNWYKVDYDENYFKINNIL